MTTPDWRRCMECSKSIQRVHGAWVTEDFRADCSKAADGWHVPGILSFDYPGQPLNLTADEEARETYAARARTALYDMFVDFEAENMDDLDERTLEVVGLFGYLMRHPEAPVPDYPKE